VLHEDYSHAGQEPTMRDIDRTVGALLIHTPASMAGTEIEATRIDTPPRHGAVIARHTGERVTHTACSAPCPKAATSCTANPTARCAFPRSSSADASRKHAGPTPGSRSNARSSRAPVTAAGRRWRLHPYTGKVDLFLGVQPQRALCGTLSFPAAYRPCPATGYCCRSARAARRRGELGRALEDTDNVA
jgi:hypothetical protein